MNTSATPGDPSPPDDDLRHLLEMIEAQLDETIRSQDEDFTAKQKLEVRLRGLDGAVRRLMDGES